LLFSAGRCTVAEKREEPVGGEKPGKKGKGGARPGAGQPLLRPEVGKLVDFSARIPEPLDRWLREQVGTKLGRSRSDVGARLMEEGAKAHGYVPRLSPEEIARLKAQREEIDRMLASQGVDPSDK
jgi:Arc/MetJ-type ribon-helix-helix transcriptional regulator